MYLPACVGSCFRPPSCQTSQSPTCPSSPTSLRRRCSPRSSTTRSCPSGRRRSRCSASLMHASTRPASTMSALPASDPPATRGVPSSRSLVSSAGRGPSTQMCSSVVNFTANMIKIRRKVVGKCYPQGEKTRNVVVLIGSRKRTGWSACCTHLSKHNNRPLAEVKQDCTATFNLKTHTNTLLPFLPPLPFLLPLLSLIYCLEAARLPPVTRNPTSHFSTSQHSKQSITL